MGVIITFCTFLLMLKLIVGLEIFTDAKGILKLISLFTLRVR